MDENKQAEVLQGLLDKLSSLDERLNNLDEKINTKPAEPANIEKQITDNIKTTQLTKEQVASLADSKYWLDNNLNELMSYFQPQFKEENVMYLKSFIDLTLSNPDYDYLSKKNKIAEQVLKKIQEENHWSLNENTTQRISQGKYEDALSDIMLAIKSHKENVARASGKDSQADLIEHYKKNIGGY